MDREVIYSKLFEQLTATAEFKTTGRKLLHWNDVSDKNKQPALFMAQTGEVSQGKKGFPSRWTLNVKVYLYCQAPDDKSPVTPIMNPLLDAIETLLDTKDNPTPGGDRLPLLPGETNDLGIPGVSHCWIEGNIETDEGALGKQAVAIIPISILVV